jgi:CheY-like chemotaxis protein
MNGNRTILFLEDDEELQSRVSAYLRERGYQVESARTAQQARQILARTRVDATIVVDGQLPGMTGVRDMGVTRILHKPYTPHELHLWLEQVFPFKASTPADDDTAAAIAALSAEYRDRLPEKYQELAAVTAQAQQGSPQALEEALKLAHRLHGTAGSYGFAQVSAAAGRLEAGFRQLLAGGGSWDTIHAALQELMTAAVLS